LKRVFGTKEEQCVQSARAEWIPEVPISDPVFYVLWLCSVVCYVKLLPSLSNH